MRVFTRRFMLAAAPIAVISPVRAAQVVTAYKTPGCACCEGWAQHLRSAGFTVNMVETAELDRIRREAGVPEAMAGCHTGFIDRLTIEGHVPAAAVERLLAAPSSWFGIAVPGMPIGSPGMEAPGQVPATYEIWGLRRGAVPIRFATARGSALLPD